MSMEPFMLIVLVRRDLQQLTPESRLQYDKFTTMRGVHPEKTLAPI
jgi:hypothetical protein